MVCTVPFTLKINGLALTNGPRMFLKSTVEVGSGTVTGSLRSKPVHSTSSHWTMHMECGPNSKDIHS